MRGGVIETGALAQCAIDMCLQGVALVDAALEYLYVVQVLV